MKVVCRLGHKDHLGPEGVRICNRDIRRCGLCKRYSFLKWEWRLCGSCFQRLKNRGGPGKRWKSA